MRKKIEIVQEELVTEIHSLEARLKELRLALLCTDETIEHLDNASALE